MCVSTLFLSLFLSISPSLSPVLLFKMHGQRMTPSPGQKPRRLLLWAGLVLVRRSTSIKAVLLFNTRCLSTRFVRKIPVTIACTERGRGGPSTDGTWSHAEARRHPECKVVKLLIATRHERKSVWFPVHAFCSVSCSPSFSVLFYFYFFWSKRMYHLPDCDRSG